MLVALALLLVVPPALAAVLHHRHHRHQQSAAGTRPVATATAAPAEVAAAGGSAFEGFGASGAWWARDTGQMPSGARTRIARLLFSGAGLALSMYRYNLGGGGWVGDPRRYAPGYLRADGSYDWSADPYGRDMLQRAAARGVERLVAFANAAPPQFTSNGRGCGGTLRSDRVGRYAAYLARVVAHLSAGGTPLAYVSPMNEPDSAFSACTQEGMSVPVALRAPLIAALQAALSRRGAGSSVIADESSEARAELLAEAPGWLSGDGGSASPGAIAYHTYDSPTGDTLRSLAALSAQVARPAFMTEVCCITAGRYSRGFHPGMTSGLWLARTIWRNLTLANATSFSWWVALSPELGCNPAASGCGSSANGTGWDDGLVYYDRNYRRTGDLRLVLTKRYYVYAQFSRAIRPGMVRHDVTGVPAGARVLAFQGSGRTVIVAIAPRGATGTTRFQLHVPWLGAAGASVYRTSNRRDASPLAGQSIAGGLLSLSLPRATVTTYVIGG
jgi:O-glycosyl hydrolase